MVKNKFGGFEELSSNTRNQIRKSCKYYKFKRIEYKELFDNGYDAYKKSFMSYGVSDLPTIRDFESFMEKCSTPIYDYWGVYSLDSNKLVAFAVNFIIGRYCNYQTLKCIPEDQKKYAYYGLIFEMNKYYLEEKHLSYVCDGAKSITGHSNIQSFLESKFKFQRMYCDIHIFYKTWLAIIVTILFPIRKMIKHPRVAALLRQEAWARGMDG